MGDNSSYQKQDYTAIYITLGFVLFLTAATMYFPRGEGCERASYLFNIFPPCEKDRPEIEFENVYVAPDYSYLRPINYTWEEGETWYRHANGTFKEGCGLAPDGCNIQCGGFTTLTACGGFANE